MTVPQFFIDIWRRLCAKTPVFFKIWQVIGIISTLIVKAPDFLNSVGLNLPVTIEPYKTIITTAGIVIAFMSQFAVSTNSKLRGAIQTK